MAPPHTMQLVGRADWAMMTAVHDALRRDLDQLLHGTASHASARTRWDTFRGQLRFHLAAEHVAMWPRVKAKLKGDPHGQALLDALDDERQLLGPLQAMIDDEFTMNANPERLCQLLVRLRTRLPVTSPTRKPMRCRSSARSCPPANSAGALPAARRVMYRHIRVNWPGPTSVGMVSPPSVSLLAARAGRGGSAFLWLPSMPTGGADRRGGRARHDKAKVEGLRSKLSRLAERGWAKSVACEPDRDLCPILASGGRNYG